MNKQNEKKHLFGGLTVLNAVLYALCGLIWLHRGLRDPAGPNRFYVVLALAWLAGAVIWAVRAW